jgi:hypothetical protein
MPEKKGGISNNGKGYKGMPFSININTPPELSARNIGTRSPEHRNRLPITEYLS